MNKVQPTTCQATSNLEVNIPDTQGRNIVLYFYPKDATPGCTTEGQDFRDHHQAFVDANTVIYGVSKDDLNKHEKFKAKQNFPFELIADVDGTLCELFKVWQLKKFMGREYMGIVRSSFIIDANGNILKSWDKVKVKGHVEEVLKEVQAL
ncbi:Thiol peroxidase, Bcp-type (EC [Bathymodiolus thermophilus thioautotrophic gill symbiont]|uniref:thioredoxin-dependent peroxiredoxin n=1 Tax=Bathymodiolus thermophilus thioautotrophic gill symbiont TaxID=2360 RepID=A0A1J5U786_9GAMM|nr:peroxiredoxin [Bathymodiolus thermophilus thioautotrophic gill symbiont]OIR24686.1 peroxiredoxin [Bathymodiolus thermophilus thioautotrophic gill symbiont]CAB5498119.1 Thiol peroxidase, Bcp-type (EC [Bathymodiolus thermophilus thioautotrophic gill symbiont]CAB5503130.1 Thiol peroxidase, Bcp-type (EC [Bathymodiolus thermophilus thioautotrophic gill symbiont]